MKINYKTSGRGENLQKFIQVMKQDEALMRLLYYNPLDENGDYVEFTDESLPNVLDFDEEDFDMISSDLIRTSMKSDDIVQTKKTVIFVHYGKSRPRYNNHLVVDREIIFHILCHNDFSFANRIEDICDRLDSLFVHQRIAGLGKVEIGNSFYREAPKEYLAYEQKYTITNRKA